MKAIVVNSFSMLLVIATVAGCSSGSTRTATPESRLIEARDSLVADLRQCTATYKYDPDNAAGLAENSLGPNELEWRNCAYSAVRTYEGSNPSLTGMYENLIAEDRSMTAAIQQGTMTRSQRRARIEALVAQIKTAEQSQAAAATTDLSRQNEQIRRIGEGIRGLH